MKDKKKMSTPLIISLLYILLGALWILLSDKILFTFVPVLECYAHFQTIKGMLFILISASFFYISISYYARKQRSNINRLQDRESRAVENLKNKDLLLRELHHRTKNNLQLIRSMMSLSLQQPGITTEDLVQDIANRIDSIALLHEKIYTSSSLDEVDMKQYLEDLLYRVGNFSPDKRIGLHIDIQSLSLDMERAIACGVIVNEVFTNAMKYAFEGKSEGTVSIKLKVQDDGSFCLIIEDDGLGFDPEQKKESFGLQLVESLVGQMDGTYTIDSDESGTRFALQAPCEARG